MRPGLPMELESGTLGTIVSRPAVGVGGRDKPGHDGAGRDGVATNAGAGKERAMRPALPREIESGTLGPTVSRPAIGVGGRDEPSHDGAGRDGVSTNAGASEERAMRPGLPMEIESGTLGRTVNRPAVVMTGLVPVTHAARGYNLERRVLGIRVSHVESASSAWVAGTSPAMTASRRTKGQARKEP